MMEELGRDFKVASLSEIHGEHCGICKLFLLLTDIKPQGFTQTYVFALNISNIDVKMKAMH